jgi:hypothetical protein
MQAVLDPPVRAHGAGKGGRIGADAADEEARLAGDFAVELRARPSRRIKSHAST